MLCFILPPELEIFYTTLLTSTFHMLSEEVTFWLMSMQRQIKCSGYLKLGTRLLLNRWAVSGQGRGRLTLYTRDW